MSQPIPLDDFEFFRDDWNRIDHAADPLRVIDPQPVAVPGAGPSVVSTVRHLPASWAHTPKRSAPRVQHTFGPPPGYVDEVWDQSDLDWAQIKALRIAATNAIAEQRTANSTEDEEQALGRRVIAELVDRMIADEMRMGLQPDDAKAGKIRRAVFDALFGLGRLQPLIDSKWIENIELHGCDVVHIELKDGTMCDGPAVADSDEELIADLQFWASRSKEHPRPFSPATPEMNLPLGESARLAAFAWVTLRPMVTIRLHGMVDVDFDDLIAKGTLTPLAANFLGAVVRAGESIVVSGAQGAGKTTLCRALCAALPPSERIITFETDRELHLERMPNKHPRVFGIEARQGQGEFRPDGREAGKFEISEALIGSLRHNADRLLVGEVRGGEIMAMIQAMQGGRGSISTTHARSARDTYNKLVTCCLEVPGVSESYATRTIASAINYVAFIKKVNIAAKGERVRRVRRVTEIIAIELTADGVSFTDVFKDDGTGVGKANTVPPYVEDLVDAGFDYDGFVRERGLS